MTDTSGPTSGRQYATYDRASQSWRMWPATGLWGSIAYSETWPRTGYMSDGRAFELPTSVPPTTASDFSSSRHLPTPKAHDGIMGRPRTSGRPIEKSTHLGTIVTLLPTPKASDFQDKTSPADARRKSPALTAVSVHFPTPTTPNRDGRGAAPEQEGRTHAPDWGPYTAAVQRWERLTRPAPAPTEPNTKGNPRLNAAFSEWMMGLPEGHVTQVPGISRADQLKAIGNGVCVQQATAALTTLLEMDNI